MGAASGAARPAYHRAVFGRVSRSALPEPEEVDWLLSVYDWLLEFAGREHFADRSLVLPTPQFFPVERRLQGHALAQELFDTTRRHAGMEDWPCRLVPHDDQPRARDMLGAIPHDLQSSHGAAGTFYLRGRGASATATITYSPRGLSDPTAFIATMAHELGHYLLSALPGEPPGGPDALEPATDVTAVFLGFGVFLATSAFTFRQFEDGLNTGWETSRLGYLDERTLTYALALFCALRGIDAGQARAHLKGNPRAFLKHAARHLTGARAADLDDLRQT